MSHKMISLQNDRQDIEDQVQMSTYKLTTVMGFCLTASGRTLPLYLSTFLLCVHLSL